MIHSPSPPLISPCSIAAGSPSDSIYVKRLWVVLWKYGLAVKTCWIACAMPHSALGLIPVADSWFQLPPGTNPEGSGMAHGLDLCHTCDRPGLSFYSKVQPPWSYGSMDGSLLAFCHPPCLLSLLFTMFWCSLPPSPPKTSTSQIIILQKVIEIGLKVSKLSTQQSACWNKWYFL